MKPPISNAEDLEPSGLAQGRHRLKRWRLGLEAGSERLGCSLIEVPPGALSWPRHWHAANEEALYILEGEGQVLVGETAYPIRPGDWVALKIGPENAHQVRNTGGAPLRYLCVSTMVEPDVSGYPDSGKIGVFAGSAPGARGERTLNLFLRTTDAVQYFTDEPNADPDP